jgi:hypothetical protein
VIARLAFRGRGRLREAAFVPSATVPLDAACVIANGIRETLRTHLGDGCAVVLGEPVALAAAAWRALVADALIVAVPGRATDVALVLARGDARRLVDAAFGEDGGDGGWSALEELAVERIVARCAAACDVICVERRGPAHTVAASALPPCVAYFDVRVVAPIALTLGVGLVRELPPSLPGPALGGGALAHVALDARVVLGRGSVDAHRIATLRPGDLLTLETKVAGDGELNVGGQRIALGTCGALGARSAFAVRSIHQKGEPP